jgi:hypothetical protein
MLVVDIDKDDGKVELPDHDNVRHGVVNCCYGVSDE